MRIKVISLFLLLYAVFQACAPHQAADDDVAALLEFQRQERSAHLQKDVPLIVDMLYDTVCQIKGGMVTYFTKDEMANRFTQYFNMVEFNKWEDSNPPVVTLSDDHSLAHILVQRHVELRLKDSLSTVEKTDFAWTELWKKNNGRWRLYTITTTDRPGQ